MLLLKLMGMHARPLGIAMEGEESLVHLVCWLTSKVVAQIPIAIHDAGPNNLHAPSQCTAAHGAKAAKAQGLN